MPKYLLSILFLFCLNAAAQTTAIPDANFEQFLFDQGIDTNGVNGNILDVDAQTVTALNVTRTDITDFTGLEAFVNLVTLNAGTNLVPTLPLTTLTLLEELRFARNTALATLNLTQNIALRVLEFNNDLAPPVLSVLDLSQNINLESLNIRTVRSITSLTLPVTATLTDIYVANLSVPTIDLSELTGDLNFRIVGSDVFVTIIYPNKKDALKRLELSSINFPTVDVSEMIGLERFGLYSTATENFILPSTNTLTNITIWGHEINVPHDLSIVPELTNLDIRNNYGSTPLQVDLTSNLELTSISLPNNLMNTVDLTQNTKLTRLDVSNNNFVTLDVTRNTLLNTFDANNNQLPTIDLSQNIELVYLRLHFNQFPSLDITNNVELTLLNIGNNLLTGTGLDLSQNAEFQLLYANNNQIESLDIDQNPKLRFLDISYNLFPGNEIINDFYDKIVVKANLSDVYFKANNNLLTGAIPDFYSIYTDNDPSVTQHRRWWFHIENNNFHFGDFENQHLDLVSLLTTQSIGPSADVVMREYTYAPQEKVNTIDSPARNAGESITLTTTVRGAQNHYKWFKDGVEITDAPDAPEYTIPDLNTCDAGVYHSEITSDLVPFENASPPGTSGKNLLLVRNDITLTVNATKDCVTLDMPLVNVPINSGIQWNDNPGACGYKISVGTTSGATDLVNDLDVGEVTVYNHSADFAPNQDIFITITPYYNDGDFSCAEQSFRTNATTVAPDCTTLNAPENGDTNVSMNLSGISWNPANGADAYRISISSTSGNNNLPLTDLGNVLTHPFSTSFQNGDIVTISIIPYNSVGDAIGPCASESFTVTGTASSSPFITTWETTAANETITIPTRPFFSAYDYTVDWGDGVVDTNVNGDITHTYNTPGVQTVSITGTFPQIHFNGNAVDRDKILTIEQWGDIEWGALTQAFKGCSRLNITNPAIDIPNLSLASNISEAFADATSFNGDITLWDVGTITNMVNLFQRASSFNQDIGDWNVSNVISMSRLFEGATLFNQDIGDWNVGSVRSMNSMFSSTTFNQDIGDWNVSQVTNMSSMFISTTNFNQDIGNWNVSNVTNMDQMFYNATAFNQDISFKAGVGIPSGDAWDTGNVTSMVVMFYQASAFNQDIGNWNVSNVIRMNQMFRNTVNFDKDISNWNVSNVTDANSMFTGATLSTTNYDALLIGWNTQNLQPNVRFSGGFSQYCDGVSARANMIASDTWIITDGGLAGPTLDDLANQNQVNSYTLPAITGTQLTGAEAYYTETNGGGTRYDAGADINFADFLSYPVTLYIYDGSGSCSSEESFQLTLTSTGAVPSCTTLSSPIDNAIDIAEDLASISWNAAANADGYRITVAGSTSNLNDVTDLVVTGTSHPFTNDFDAEETVTITITPFNADGDASGCIAESFTIAAAGTLPSCTTLSNPLNGATNAPTNITLTWNSVTDVDGYLVQIGTSPGNTDFSNQDVGNTTSIDLNGLPENTTFYITIVPYNGTGNATGCIEESFTTITGESRPDCTTLSSPINGETDVALNASINWNTVSNATGYRITVGSINGGGELANNQDMGNTTTFTFGPGFIESVTYYVTVMPYNAAGQALGCSEESFTTVPPRMSPSCTSLISPLNLAIDVAVDTNIAWNVVSEADGYRLTLGTTSGGNGILDNLDVENVTTFDLPNNLPSNTEIFVSIIPYNSVGNASLCSEESFITEDSVMDDAPSCSILNLPSNGDTDVPVNTMIRWNAVGDIDGYLLSIGTTEGGSDILNNSDVGLTTSYEPTAELPPGQEIFVTIIPYNAAVQAENCVTQSITTIAEEEEEDETLYGFSPNGDGINDFWTIDGIESSPENTVFIYNRWGDLVFQIQGYNNQTSVFRGTANNKTQMGAGELPSGTYFFNIQVSGAHNLKKLQGFLVIKR